MAARLRLFHKFRSTALFETLLLTITENLALNGALVPTKNLKDKTGECLTAPRLKIKGKMVFETRRARGNIASIKIALNGEPRATLATAAHENGPTIGRSFAN